MPTGIPGTLAPTSAVRPFLLVTPTSVRRGRERLECRCQFVDARCRLELGERVAAVDERRSSEVVAFGEGRGAVVSTWGMRTLHGNRCSAVMTTVVDAEQSGPDDFAEGRRDCAVEQSTEDLEAGGMSSRATMT